VFQKSITIEFVVDHILAGSFQTNRTYQFQVVMTNLLNRLQQSIGYLTVQIQESSSIVQIGFVDYSRSNLFIKLSFLVLFYHHYVNIKIPNIN
jgi:hypothetical protein